MKRLILACATTLAMTVTSLGLVSCIDEVAPSDKLTSNQVKALSRSQEGLLNGIVAYMTTIKSWDNSADPLQDWGYPCQMEYRDVLGSDMPVSSSNYSYWSSVESGTDTRFPAYYTFTYYYKLIETCNDLTSVIDPATASQQSKEYYGAALTFRAMAYLDIARMFEFKPTGISSLDSKAEKDKIWGLTVPIVTEKVAPKDVLHNPRAPFYTMYRFILTDLNNAEEYLKNYNRATKDLPNQSVVYGLKARLWLELATRFDRNPSDLATALAAEDSTSIPYDKLGVTSVNACYAKAREYARLASQGYSPVTQTEWLDTETGFNKPNQAWLWCMSYSTREQLTWIYYTFTSTMITEIDWGLTRAYGSIRMIGSWLYSQMGKGDWRRYSWIAPDAAGTHEGYKQYDSLMVAGKKMRLSLLDEESWKALPAYSNTKYRPAKGNISDSYESQFISIPLMRVEEMTFIDLECTAHLDGVAAAASALQTFINGSRYTDNSYQVNATTMDEFMNELIKQKRIEFWGEGLIYFDLKRLAIQIRRRDNTNYEPLYLINSKEGYVCPWLNYFILENETHRNVGCKPNPDTSGSLTVTNQ